MTIGVLCVAGGSCVTGQVDIDPLGRSDDRTLGPRTPCVHREWIAVDVVGGEEGDVSAGHKGIDGVRPAGASFYHERKTHKAPICRLVLGRSRVGDANRPSRGRPRPTLAS